MLDDIPCGVLKCAFCCHGAALAIWTIGAPAASAGNLKAVLASQGWFRVMYDVVQGHV